MRKKAPLVILFTVLLLGLVVAFLFSGRGISEQDSISSAIIQKDGAEITIGSDGSVWYMRDDESLSENWSEAKLRAFWEYLNREYMDDEPVLTASGKNSVTINVGNNKYTYVLDDDDELVDAIEDDIVNPPSPEDDPGGSEGSTPPPGGGSGGGTGGGGGGNSECLFWRISYCVRLRTPVPTATPGPQVQVDIREPDCQYNQDTGKTVLGDELCITPDEE